jgi:hypothetical protein
MLGGSEEALRGATPQMGLSERPKKQGNQFLFFGKEINSMDREVVCVLILQCYALIEDDTAIFTAITTAGFIFKAAVPANTARSRSRSVLRRIVKNPGIKSGFHFVPKLQVQTQSIYSQGWSSERDAEKA